MLKIEFNGGRISLRKYEFSSNSTKIREMKKIYLVSREKFLINAL